MSRKNLKLQVRFKDQHGNVTIHHTERKEEAGKALTYIQLKYLSFLYHFSQVQHPLNSAVSNPAKFAVGRQYSKELRNQIFMKIKHKHFSFFIVLTLGTFCTISKPHLFNCGLI